MSREARDPAPPGFRWEWVPEGNDWRLASIEERRQRVCRTSSQHPCPNTVVAALNRGRVTRRGRFDSWWFYCGDHLYGRRIRNGVIEKRRLVAIEEGSS